MVEEKYFWNFDIYLNYSDDDKEKPFWEKIWRDIEILDKLIYPLYSNNKEFFELWRFHRGENANGHDFKLTFYSTDIQKEKIKKRISEDKYFKGLVQDKVVRKFEDIGEKNKDTINIYMDVPGWDESLKRTYPYYINGICNYFLYLVKDVKEEEKLKSNEENIIYKRVNNKINSLWYGGTHHYLHMLNQVFAYSPILARPSQMTGMEVIF